MKERSDGYLPTLDGWRAIAILLVVICHGTDAIFGPGGLLPDARWHGLTRYGALGVDLFFGISGFLICTRLLQEYEQRGCISLKQFYLRRAWRILPPYLAYLAALGVLAGAGWVAVERQEWWSCLFFFRNYIAPRFDGWYTGHFWSLAVEEHFYLLWPGFLVLFTPLFTPRKARWLVLVIALCVAVWRVFDFRYHLVASVLPGVTFYGRTDIRFDALLFGCWAALVVFRMRARLAAALSPAIWLLLVGCFICCVAFKPPLAMLWQSLLIPFMLVGTVLRPESLAGRMLERVLLQWIGRISYSLYLWQQLFLVGSDVPRISQLGVWQAWPLNLLAVFGCAVMSYYLIERPAIKIGHRLIGRRSQAQFRWPAPSQSPQVSTTD